MRMNQKTRLVMAMAFSVASSAVLAQDAVFSNLVTCTKGRCRAGYSVTASFGSTQSGAGCSAYGTHKVTIGFNGETQTVTAVCSGGTSCVGDAYVNIGGRDFGVFVNADAQIYAQDVCERMADGAHSE